MAYETIILEKKDKIAKVTINRPERLNSINAQVTKELTEAFRDVDGDDEMRVLVITGAGRAFCAGADLGRRSEGPEGRRARAQEGAEQMRRSLARQTQQIQRMLPKMEKPTIAMVNGVAAGGGCDLALACDLRTGSENTRFVNAFIRIGLFPGGGGTWLWPRVVGVSRALQYLYTGDFLEAKEAERIGMINWLFPADQLEKETMALAARIANGPPIAMRLTKLQVYEGLGMDFDTALQIAAACETITRSSEDNKEGVLAYLEKRPPKYQDK